jgi:hypothetical protein
MATFAILRQPIAVFRDRSNQPKRRPAMAGVAAAVDEVDPMALPGLPNDDVYLFCKRIDNTRVVRQPSAKASGELSAIGGVGTVALLIAMLAIPPGVASVLDSYKIQDLKKENVQLRNEWKQVEVAEEKLVNAAQLNLSAEAQHLVRPGPGQVIPLQPKNSRSFAMNGLRPR